MVYLSKAGIHDRLILLDIQLTVGESPTQNSDKQM